MTLNKVMRLQQKTGKIASEQETVRLVKFDLDLS